MTVRRYPKYLSLVELAQHYVNYRDEEVLNELARRDIIAERVGQHLEEPDNQMAFDFHIASAQEVANNVSVKEVTFKSESARDQWAEGYEIGRQVGFGQGLKEAPCDGIKEEGECRCKK